MNKSTLFTLVFGIGLVVTWSVVGYAVMTTQTTPAETTPTVEECEPTQEVEETAEIDTSLITFGVTEDYGDVVVYYDGAQKIVTTLTAGWYDSISIIATDGDYVYANIAPDGMGGYILYSGYYWVFRIDTSNWTYVQLPIDGFITDLNLEHQLAVMKDDIQGRMMMSVLDLNTFEKKSYAAPSEYGQIGDGLLSPDGTKFAFAASAGSPVDPAQSVIYVVDLEKRTTDTYAPIIQGVYRIHGWADNETLDFSF